MSMEAIGRKSCSARQAQAQSGFPCSDREMTALPHTEPATRFCSRCAAPAAELGRRVCGQCEEGVLLGCREDAFPSEAFLICTYDLELTAVSTGGEPVFGAQEQLVGAQLLDVVTCPLGDEQVARYAALAAQSPSEPIDLPLRVRAGDGEKLGMLAARVTTCGPPRAALLSVQPSGFGRR
jgi:hypothetical protein